MRKKISIPILTVLAATVMVWGTVSFRSYSLYERGKDALTENSLLEAITLLERSALWYIPLAPYSGKAIETLKDISEDLRAKGDSMHRNAELALIRINRQLSMWNVGTDSAMAGPLSPARRVLIHLSFLGWLLGAVFFFFSGFARDGSVIWRKASKSALLAIFFAAAWLYLLAV